MRKENNPKGGCCKRLHRNHLLPIRSIQDVFEVCRENSGKESVKASEKDLNTEVESESDDDVDENDLQLHVSSSSDDEDLQVVRPTQGVAVDAAVEPAAAPMVDRGRPRRIRTPVDRYQSVDYRH